MGENDHAKEGIAKKHKEGRRREEGGRGGAKEQKEEGGGSGGFPVSPYILHISN